MSRNRRAHYNESKAEKRPFAEELLCDSVQIKKQKQKERKRKDDDDDVITYIIALWICMRTFLLNIELLKVYIYYTLRT